MKKRLFVIFVIVLLVFALSSCFDRSGSFEKTNIAYGEDGVYSDFSDIPDNYSVDGAIDDGCLVIETLDDGTNIHGVSMRKTGRTEGYEHWVSFVEKSQRGEDAFLRVAHFICGTGYYHDLYYSDGKYTIFDFNEYGISEGKSYSFLRRLDGMAGAGENRHEDHFYVLTDDTKLTYRDVSSRYFSSTISPNAELPYYHLMFMGYFDEEEISNTENYYKEENDLSIEIVYNGVEYSGFGNIPDGYSINQAIDDGCLVVVTVTDGTNTDRITVRNEITEDYEYWQNFLEKSQRGDDAFLRTIHSVLGNIHIYDLYYCDGKYTIFELNYGEVSEGRSFSLLRRLDGMKGDGNDHIYVLTDDTELTYDEVKLKYHVSSSIYAYSQSDFYWMIFLTHFE